MAVEGLLMICANENFRQCHLIVASMSVNYEEQVVIIGIKSGMQCSIYQELSKEYKNLYKI